MYAWPLYSSVYAVMYINMSVTLFCRFEAFVKDVNRYEFKGCP